MKYRLSVAYVALVLATSSNALTLQEAVSHVIDTNPVVQERLKNYNATREDLTIAKSDWLPKLDYYGSAGYEWGEREITGYRWQDYPLFENSLILTQNLFDGWGTTHRIKTQEARVLAAAYKYVEVVHDTAYRLVNYYLEVVKNRELLKTAEENIRINEDIYNKVKKLYEGGLTTKSEMEKAAASLSLARSNYVVQKNNLQDALMQFKYYYGDAVKPEELEAPSFEVPVPADYRIGLDFAMQHNPSIWVQRYNIQVAKEDYAQRKSNYYPKFDLQAQGGWNYNINGESFGHEDLYRVAGVMRYNLFNGFADKAAVQQGISKVQQEVALKSDLERQTREGYDLSWAAYTHLKEKLNFLKNYEDHAASTLRLYSKEYEMGRRSLLDLLSAQNDLINAKSQIVSTLYGYLFAKYRILDAMGTMVPTVVGSADGYFKRVGLGGEQMVKKDSLPQEVLDENEQFIHELNQKVAVQPVLAFEGETVKEGEPVSVDTHMQEMQMSALDKSASEEKVTRVSRSAQELLADETSVKRVETEGPYRQVVQLLMTTKRHAKAAEAVARKWRRRGWNCYVKPSIDGVHLYVRCLPKAGDMRALKEALKEAGVDYLVTDESLVDLKNAGIELAD